MITLKISIEVSLHVVDLLSNLSNQILVKRPQFVFIANVEYEKLPHFCLDGKIMAHVLSNHIQLQDANAISSGEKRIGNKNTTLSS